LVEIADHASRRRLGVPFNFKNVPVPGFGGAAWHAVRNQLHIGVCSD
jgi:hypothetical protein